MLNIPYFLLLTKKIIEDKIGRNSLKFFSFKMMLMLMSVGPVAWKNNFEWLVEYIQDCTHLSTILCIAFTIIIALLYALCKTVGKERSENTNYLPEWKTIVETQWLTFFVVVVWLHSGKMLFTKLGSSFLRRCPHPARGQLGQGSDWMWRGS